MRILASRGMLACAMIAGRTITGMEFQPQGYNERGEHRVAPPPVLVLDDGSRAFVEDGKLCRLVDMPDDGSLPA